MNGHDAIVAAVLNALRLPTPVTAGPIEEDVDLDALAEGHSAGINVAVAASDPARTGYQAPVQWQSELVVQCLARADGRTAAGRASRALHQAVYQRLMADPSLGGQAMDLLEPVLRFERDQADTRVGLVIATYPVVHRTAAGSLEAAA